MAVRIRDRRAPILAALMLTVVIPVYGKLSDLYGRKPVLVIGVLVFLAACGAAAVPDSAAGGRQRGHLIRGNTGSFIVDGLSCLFL